MEGHVITETLDPQVEMPCLHSSTQTIMKDESVLNCHLMNNHLILGPCDALMNCRSGSVNKSDFLVLSSKLWIQHAICYQLKKKNLRSNRGLVYDDDLWPKELFMKKRWTSFLLSLLIL